MASVNHFIGAVVTPVNIGLVMLVGALVWRRARGWLVGAGLVWIWLWSTPLMFGLLGRGLENYAPMMRAEDHKEADAIVILGGGMGIADTNDWPYVEAWAGCDRVLHGARAWRARRAPRIFCTGDGAEQSTVPLLVELGVPREVVMCLDARNTEEEARAVAHAIVGSGQWVVGRKPRVLLVTSAWHMRRAELMFRKAGLEVECAPCDYETIVRKGKRFSFEWGDLWPTSEMQFYNTYLFKEHYAYWGYKLLRGF